MHDSAAQAEWIARERPDESEMVAVGYGSDGNVVAEAALLEDGTTHITTVIV